MLALVDIGYGEHQLDQVEQGMIEKSCPHLMFSSKTQVIMRHQKKAAHAKHGPSPHFRASCPTINVQKTHGMKERRGVQYRQLLEYPNSWLGLYYTRRLYTRLTFQEVESISAS